MRRVASRLKNESRRLRKTCPASGIPRVYQARTQANDAVREETNPTQERTIMSHPIHLEVSLPASPERYYELLINGAKLGDVTGQPGKGGGSEGAYFELFGGWLQGRQIELGKNERVTQAWRFRDWDPGVYSIVRFTLEPEGKGTKLTMDQDGVPAEFVEHVRTNWKGFYFDPLAKVTA
ncbi:MAG: SRPBCC domain-containing protein [Polyangiaceae bacterium]